MKAIVYREYGSADVLRYADVPRPAPGRGELLVKVRAASVNPIDWHLMRGEPYFLRLASGLRWPKVPTLGVDVAGEVESVGAGVEGFRIGDAVFGGCRGAFAEYVAAPASWLAPKPVRVSFEEAASAPAASYTALQALRDYGRVMPGHDVLVHGAAGGVGTFAVQIAKSFGATVTGVCSTANVEMVRSIGADRVIDYTRDAFRNGHSSYDVILDCVGERPLWQFASMLAKHGRYVGIGAPAGRWMIGAIGRAVAATMASLLIPRKLHVMVARPRKEDIAAVGDLMASGRVTPVIDRPYRLSDAAEAVRYVERGHARGKVVVIP